MPRLLRLAIQLAVLLVCAAHAAAQTAGNPPRRAPGDEHSAVGQSRGAVDDRSLSLTATPPRNADASNSQGRKTVSTKPDQPGRNWSQLAPPSHVSAHIADPSEAADPQHERTLPGDHDVSPNAGGSIALPPRDDASESMSLAPRSDSGSSHALNTIPSLATVFGSLAIVLGLFLIVAWTMRRKLASGPRGLPPDVVEALGRAELPGRHELQLVRFGRKLLLVSISSGSTETLTEITDPIEVDRLAGLCHQKNGQSSTHVFSQVFDRFGRDSDSRGFAPASGESTNARHDASRAAGRRLVESRDG